MYRGNLVGAKGFVLLLTLSGIHRPSYAQSASSDEEADSARAEDADPSGEGDTAVEDRPSDEDVDEAQEPASDEPSSETERAPQESEPAEARATDSRVEESVAEDEGESVSADAQEEKTTKRNHRSAQTSAAAAPEVELSASELQDIDLLELLEIDVSTATKTSESLDEAPAVITAVTANDIRRWGYQSVGEVLQHIMGFYMIDDHITPNVAVRGISGGLAAESGFVKVMIDGRSVAFRTTSGNWLGVELIPLSAVKQIEVIRGPASALYGADAFLGVVNIITIAAEDVASVDATVRGGVVGNNPSGSFDVTSGLWGEEFDFMLTAAGEMSNRTGLEMPEESPAPRIPTYNQGETKSQDLSRRSIVVGGRVGYTHPEQGHHLTFSAYGSGMERGGDFAQWAQLSAGEDAAGREVGTVINLGQFRVTGDALYNVTKKIGIALQSTYFQGGTLPNDRIEVGSDLYYVERKMAYRGVDVNLEGRLALHKRFNFIVGVETLYDHEALPTVQRISKEDDELLGETPQVESVDFVNLASFMSANLQVIDRWLKLTGGLRYDHHNLYGGQVTGRAGATSRLSNSVVAKLLYGSAFKAPSPYLLYAKPLVAGDVIGNSELAPQYIDTWEAQVSWRLNHGVSASTGVSYSVLRDKAEFIPQGINQTAQNIANQKALTWETRVDAKKGDAYGGYGSFELVNSTRDLDDHGYQADLIGTEMVVYPPWTARLGAFVAIPSPKKFPVELSSEGIVVGPRRAADASILENGGSFTLDPYVHWNASVRLHDAQIFQNNLTSVALRVKNILGSSGPDPGFSAFEYPLTARSVFLELRHRY